MDQFLFRIKTVRVEFSPKILQRCGLGRSLDRPYDRHAQTDQVGFPMLAMAQCGLAQRVPNPYQRLLGATKIHAGLKILVGHVADIESLQACPEKCDVMPSDLSLHEIAAHGLSSTSITRVLVVREGLVHNLIHHFCG